MQTLQTNQTINQFTLIFFNFCENLGCYNTTPPIRDLVPTSRTIRGRGGEKRESTIFNTTNKGLCSMSNVEAPSIYFPQRDGYVGKRNHKVFKRKNDNESWVKR